MFSVKSMSVSAMTIEGHVYRCSVTLLLATAYILFGWIFYQVCAYIMTRYASLNPDVDTVSDEEQAMHLQSSLKGQKTESVVQRKVVTALQMSRYKRLMDDLRELDPTVDFENGIESERHCVQRIENKTVTECSQTTEEQVAAGGSRSEPDGKLSMQNSTQSELEYTIEDVLDEPKTETIPRTMHMLPQSVFTILEKNQHMRQFAQSDETQSTSILQDLDFMLAVYGYGIVIFVTYYSVDMLILTPSLSILSGLMFISIRDIWDLFHTQNIINKQQESQVICKTVTCTAFALLVLGTMEMFIMTGHFTDENLLTESPSYITLTFILPSLACTILTLLPRECYRAQHIRRAFPTTVLIALFVVIWASSVDVMVSHEKELLQEQLDVLQADCLYGSRRLLESKGEDSWKTPSVNSSGVDNIYFHDEIVYPVLQDSIQYDDIWESDTHQYYDYAEPTPYDEIALPVYADFVSEEGKILHDVYTPITQEIPLFIILLEPLFKLALTFSVITAAVSHKTVEISAAICFIVSLKQCLVQESTEGMEHMTRAATFAACAMFIAAIRYLPCFQRWIKT